MSEPRRRRSEAPAVRADARALLSEALAHHQSGRLFEAETRYQQVLADDAGQFDALHLLGLVHHQRGDFSHALDLIDRALAVRYDVAAAHNSRAAALNGLARFEEALACCDTAIALKPEFGEAWANRGFALLELKRFEQALLSCDRAIALKPELAEAVNNRGNALRELGRLSEALASYDRAIALRPDFGEAFNNRANVLNQLKRFDEALASSGRAIAFRPDMAQAFYNRGIAQHELKRFEEALASYDEAIARAPRYAEALVNRGTVLLDLRRYDAAAESYRRALTLDPDQKYLRGMHLHSRMLLCDWTDFEVERAQLAAVVGSGAAASLPFHLMSCSPDPDLQRRCARRYIQDKLPHSPPPLWQGEAYAHSRIRIAYLSSDFGDHPVSLLAAGLFERHDRSRFETTAVSFGRHPPGAMRARLHAAFDRFIDASVLGDVDVARLVRELEIDIAIDLNGFTDGARLNVLAHRAAPVQVNYLGYAGTMAHSHWDYVIADPFVIPPEHRRCYAEQVVYLPNSFMVTDAGRAVSDRVPSRAQAGLPEDGVVFCCFNNAYKVTPDVFDVWMRLLRDISGSVLWLSAVNPTAADNLRREAAARGVAPNRLVFAPKMASNEDHLARMRLADLFIDTLSYNAHATAADALWAGVPVLTCAGAAFASRVAGSLLHAIGLPELITCSLSDYEMLALRLARDPALLSSVRRKLADNRHVYPLFDTGRFARHLEAAYTGMWQRTQRGEPPQGFAVAAAP